MSKTNHKPDVCRLRCKTCRRPICTGARLLTPPRPARRRVAFARTPEN